MCFLTFPCLLRKGRVIHSPLRQAAHVSRVLWLLSSSVGLLLSFIRYLVSFRELFAFGSRLALCKLLISFYRLLFALMSGKFTCTVFGFFRPAGLVFARWWWMVISWIDIYLYLLWFCLILDQVIIYRFAACLRHYEFCVVQVVSLDKHDICYFFFIGFVLNPFLASGL